ncbi:MAG TPA: hypothetical protein VJU84_17825 [Pyrinomonadaceae bacterium]|nr:hypothetical protein [Pyrinomonadaceae bacterium]
MNRHLHSMKRSKARLVAFIAVLSVLVGGAVTVVSRQSDRAGKSGEALTNPALSVRATVQDKSIPQTTPIQEITPEEAQRLTEAVRPMVSKSTEGLVESIDADGGVAIDVKDRFQNVTVARRNADGSISYSCVDTPESASAFFQPSRSPKQAGAGTRTAPVRR